MRALERLREIDAANERNARLAAAAEIQRVATLAKQRQDWLRFLNPPTLKPGSILLRPASHGGLHTVELVDVDTQRRDWRACTSLGIRKTDKGSWMCRARWYVGVPCLNYQLAEADSGGIVVFLATEPPPAPWNAVVVDYLTVGDTGAPRVLHGHCTTLPVDEWKSLLEAWPSELR